MHSILIIPIQQKQNKTKQNQQQQHMYKEVYQSFFFLLKISENYGEWDEEEQGDEFCGDGNYGDYEGEENEPHCEDPDFIVSIDMAMAALQS